MLRRRLRRLHHPPHDHPLQRQRVRRAHQPLQDLVHGGRSGRIGRAAAAAGGQAGRSGPVSAKGARQPRFLKPACAVRLLLAPLRTVGSRRLPGRSAVAGPVPPPVCVHSPSSPPGTRISGFVDPSFLPVSVPATSSASLEKPSLFNSGLTE
uniref:Uncharacterized protein n=1 Tax=Aquila chrysaetos chrysaetos TaxID=223781 RepID=A0A663E2Y6_AQUCH